VQWRAFTRYGMAHDGAQPARCGVPARPVEKVRAAQQRRRRTSRVHANDEIAVIRVDAKNGACSKISLRFLLYAAMPSSFDTDTMTYMPRVTFAFCAYGDHSPLPAQRLPVSLSSCSRR